jgi:F420-non-reducing hydrogenase small subunit
LTDSHEAKQGMKNFAVLQLSGCSGCEVALLNAGEWLDQYRLVYMPLVVSTHNIPRVDVLLVTGGIRTDEDLYNLRRAARQADQVVAVGTCAISGGIASLGDRDEVRELFLAGEERRLVPRLLPRCSPIDTAVSVDLLLPGCPPTPELFLAVLNVSSDFKPAKTVCQECGRKKVDDMRPTHLLGPQHGEVLPDICLVNQGFLCVGTSTRGGCRALCTRPGHPCVGCRGPSDAFIEEGTAKWLNVIRRVFSKMTDISDDELDEALRSPQLSMFLFQFSDYFGTGRPPREKEKVL